MSASSSHQTLRHVAGPSRLFLNKRNPVTGPSAAPHRTLRTHQSPVRRGARCSRIRDFTTSSPAALPPKEKYRYNFNTSLSFTEEPDAEVRIKSTLPLFRSADDEISMHNFAE